MATVADLVAQLGAPKAEMAIPVKGIECHFRLPTDAAEFYRLRQAARVQVDVVKGGKCPPEVAKLGGGMPDEILRQCYWVSALSVDPRIEMSDAVLMAARNGPVIGYLHETLMAEIGGYVIAEEVAEIGDAGEDSGAMISTAPASESPETCTADTQTN